MPAPRTTSTRSRELEFLPALKLDHGGKKDFGYLNRGVHETPATLNDAEGRASHDDRACVASIEGTNVQTDSPILIPSSVAESWAPRVAAIGLSKIGGPVALHLHRRGALAVIYSPRISKNYGAKNSHGP